MRSGTVLLLMILLSLAPVFAGTITLHFDELGTSSPVDFSTPISVSGVTFAFFPDTAQYNGSINAIEGVTTLNLSDPVLTGPTSGTLILDFANPTTVLNFDIAMESVFPILNAYTVAIGGNLFSGDTTPLVMYSEGSYSYSGGAAFTSAAITFSNEAPVFALDNLTFSAPEPGTELLIGAALLALAVAVKSRQGRAVEKQLLYRESNEDR